ncbi:MAG: hypothetical protein IPK58_08365 [Acidobacteria bacterium]|nr:hypothetical protein [Acidobacteriota bacterium]
MNRRDLQELASPVTKVRKALTKHFRRYWDKFTPGQRFWVGFALLCLITTALINNPLWRTTAEQYKEGDIARESIVSPADISVTDNDETERLREAARTTVQPIFRYESNKPDQAGQRFLSSWEKLQRQRRPCEHKRQAVEFGFEERIALDRFGRTGSRQGARLKEFQPQRDRYGSERDT